MEIIDEVYEICEKYQFEELDEDADYIKIEFTGTVQTILGTISIQNSNIIELQKKYAKSK